MTEGGLELRHWQVCLFWESMSPRKLHRTLTLLFIFFLDINYWLQRGRDCCRRLSFCMTSCSWPTIVICIMLKHWTSLKHVSAFTIERPFWALVGNWYAQKRPGSASAFSVGLACSKVTRGEKRERRAPQERHYNPQKNWQRDSWAMESDRNYFYLL